MSPQDHMARVAALGCIVGRLGWSAECSGRTCVHHIREGQGMTDRASDWLTLPVCEAHHDRFPFGVHYKRAFRTRTGMTELDLLGETIKALA
jgi:hypothetical protein